MKTELDYGKMLSVAILEARKGLAEGGLPIGAAIFDATGKVLGVGHNRRVQDGDPSKAGIDVSESLAATRLNGNNVNIDFELLASSENVMRQKLAVQALNAKYQLLRTAIGNA